MCGITLIRFGFVSRGLWTRSRKSMNIRWSHPLQVNRRFSSLTPKWTAHSVLKKHGLNADWLEKKKQTVQDHGDTLFSRRLGFDSQEIRLLYIMPSENYRSQMEMVMAHCNLDSLPSYEALSYTGGNPYTSDSLNTLPKGTNDPWEEKTDIMVNGIAFPIRRNLLEALRRFRVTHAMKAIWIDSICINEADPVEHTEQVRLMGKIYGEAKDVPIWLGERTDGLDTALTLVMDMIRAFTKWYDTNHPPGFRDFWNQIIRSAVTTPDALDQKLYWEFLQSEKCQPFFDNIDLRTLGVRTDRMAWDFLRNLVSRRWFDRVWTWQEKELAKRATVYVGERTLLWAELKFAMLLVMAHDLSKTRTTPSTLMPGREYLHVLDSLSISKSPDLLDIVMNVRHRDTQLERDKIFGVLGAAVQYQNQPSEDVEHFLRLVNYGYLTTQDLYREFSRYWIIEKRDLRVLQACNPSKRKIKELPSWVADWSDTALSYQLCSRLYNAAKGKPEAEVRYHYHLNSNELQLTGILIDTVKLVCNDENIDNIEYYLATRTIELDYWQAQLVQPLTSLYAAGIGAKAMDVLEPHWRQAAQDIDWDRPYLPTGQSMAEAFWRTLLVDKNPYVTNATDQRIAMNVNLASIFDRWAQRRAVHRSLLQRNLRDRIEVEVDTQRWLEALCLSLMYNRFFVTESGLVGLAPKGVQIGDHVCVLYGGKVPFTLRKKEDYYTLVNETYLHGFMDGEAIELAKKGELDEINFCVR